MGKNSLLKRTFVAAALMIVTGLFLLVLPEKSVSTKQIRLGKVINDLGKWTGHQDIPLEKGILKELQLDDYLFRTFDKGGQQVALYIGYYFSSKKVGAAHDPLVCFPGQGWKISNRNTSAVQLDSGHLKTLPLITMIVEAGQRKSLIAYWFQAGDSPHLTTFEQKLSLLMGQVKSAKGDNAFIRVSVPLESISQQEGLDIILDFLKSFYPEFEKYIAA